jgi:hypothetical protein
MSYSVAADEVLDGRWSVVDETGTVARRRVRRAQRTVLRPAVFRTRDEATECARRWNVRLDRLAGCLTSRA